MGNYGGGDRETKKANTAKMMYWKREREKMIEKSDRCWGAHRDRCWGLLRVLWNHLAMRNKESQCTGRERDD